MANQEWIQELEDSQSWINLDSVCFSNEETIHCYRWFDDLFQTIEHPYQEIISNAIYLVIRTNRDYATIFSFLRSLFLKIAEIDVVEIASEDIEFTGAQYPKDTLRAYAVEYIIIRPELWNTENLAKLIYYIYIVSSLIDYPFGRGVITGSTLGNIVFSIFHKDRHINEDRFIHRGMAKLLNSLIDLRQTNKRESSFVFDGPRFISNDIEGIGFVLQSREDLNEALNRVDGFDVTKMTDEILIQYDKMRRNF